MKKQFWILCLLALVFGVGLMLSSCKDNLTDSGSIGNPDEEEALEKGSEKGEALLSILNYAAGLDSLPDDWYKSSYTVEPTIGQAIDPSNPYVRYVSASSAASANVTYRSMISADVTADSVTNHSWSKDGIGTLDFKVVSGQPDVVATVDVDVKQLPHLRQIRFVPPSAMPENSSWFTGDPFYQFGDIVKDVQEGTYWICARPADKAAKKSTTHWVSFSMSYIEGVNFKKCTKKGKATLVLPNDLGDKTGSEEFVPDFLQFLKAISPGLTGNDGATYNSVEISDVKRTVKDLSFIANFWKEKGIMNQDNEYKGVIIPSPVKTLLFNTVIKKAFEEEKKELNVFYYGNHAGSTPDVHMLTIDGLDPVNTTKTKIQFEWPTDNGVHDYFHSYANTGKKNPDIDNLKIKTAGVTWPENAILVRYKTGPQLSGSSTIWGNDEYPGKSFSEYAKKTIEDIYLYKNRALTSYYTLGDVVNTKEYGKFYCIKPFCSDYRIGNNYAFFLSPVYNENITGRLMDSERRDWKNLPRVAADPTDIKIAMFHLMGAYLATSGEKTFVELDDRDSYYKCLLRLWNQLCEGGLKKAFTQKDDEYILKLCFLDVDMVRRYTLIYNKNGTYNFVKGNMYEENEGYPTVTLVYYQDEGIGSKYLFELTDDMSDVDGVTSSKQAADAYLKSVIN